MSGEIKEGKFIVLEGPDGAGSTTQIKLLGKYLEEQRGLKVHVTKEPTNRLIGGLIRSLLTKDWRLDSYGTQLLFCADRAHHLQTDVEPALAKGWYVLTDRYYPSTIIYGSMAIDETRRDGDQTDYWRLLSDINDPFRTPDLTMILEMDPKECMRRILHSRPSTESFEHEEALRKVMDNYRRFVSEQPNAFLIDGMGERS